MKRSIMIIEDNDEMANLISIILGEEGFQTTRHASAEEALEALPEQPADLIVLDINLPGMDGYEFITRARKISAIPILIVTARKSDTDVVAGLGYGADDFISKPFSSAILTARVRALLRRAVEPGQAAKDKADFGPFSFDFASLSLHKDDAQIELTTKEARVLEYLLRNAGKPLTPKTIYENVWKNQYGDVTSVAVYVQKLRRKIEADPAEPAYLRTVFGRGYCFVPDEAKGSAT